MTVMIEYYIVYISMTIFNMIIHGTGIYLLVRLYRRGEKSPQRMYLINLSLCEMIQNIMRFIFFLFSLLRLPGNIPTNDQTTLFSQFIRFILNTSVHYSVISTMFVLTGDRLLSIILGIRYPSFWTFRKTVVLLTCIWSFNLLVAIAVGVYNYNSIYITYQIQMTVFRVLIYYVPTANLVIFLLFAVIAYIIMFNKFYRSHRVARSRSQGNQSRLKAFRHSKFYICVFLLTSFLILLVIPSISCIIYWISTGRSPPAPYMIYVNLSMISSDSVDALIYIFLQPSVKKLFVKTFCWWCCAGDCCSGRCATSQNPPKSNISVVERRSISNDQQRGDCNRREGVFSSPHDGIITSTRL